MLCLANNTAITDTFDQLKGRFVKLYARKAHCHHYTEYMDEANFDQALEVHTLLKDNSVHPDAPLMPFLVLVSVFIFVLVLVCVLCPGAQLADGRVPEARRIHATAVIAQGEACRLMIGCLARARLTPPRSEVIRAIVQEDGRHLTHGRRQLG